MFLFPTIEDNNLKCLNSSVLTDVFTDGYVQTFKSRYRVSLWQHCKGEQILKMHHKEMKMKFFEHKSFFLVWLRLMRGLMNGHNAEQCHWRTFNTTSHKLGNKHNAWTHVYSRRRGSELLLLSLAAFKSFGDTRCWLPATVSHKKHRRAVWSWCFYTLRSTFTA